MEIQIVIKESHFIFQYGKKEKDIVFNMEGYNNTTELKENKKELNNVVIILIDKENTLLLCSCICLMITDTR